ncbi:MAG: hypothetical protein WDW36_000909 [Sanguina aurantia]
MLLAHSRTKDAPILSPALHPPTQRDASVQAHTDAQSSRRHLISTTVAGLLTAIALGSPHPASAIAKNKNLCIDKDTEAESDQCRRGLLQGDATKKEDYSSASDNKYSAAPNVPVSVLGDKYAKETLALRDSIITYATMDAGDFKVRVPLIKVLKAEGLEWVSKYARGGSARKESARRMYIAVDALIGHLASNGFAPMPAPKIKTMLKTIDEAKAFLAEGK